MRALEHMARCTGLLLALAFAAVGGCADPRDEGKKPGPHFDDLVADDRAVFEVVLEDFAAWKDATFGVQEGVLALDPLSAELVYRNLADTRQSIAPITNVVSDELIEAFLKRNKSRIDVTSLVARLPSVRSFTRPDKSGFFEVAPDGAKAIGSISMPGFDPGRTRAMVQINHSWSIHGAVVTYVLSKQDGTWKIQARDQQVFL